MFLLLIHIGPYFVGYGIIDIRVETLSISVTMVRKFGLGDYVTRIHELIMRDSIYFSSIGELKELPVKIKKLRFHINFLVMGGISDEEITTPIILGRIFLAQCSTKIDYRMMHLIISSRVESKMHGLQNPELELRHKGVVHPICAAAFQESRISGSYISEKEQKEETDEDLEEDPNCISKEAEAENNMNLEVTSKRKEPEPEPETRDPKRTETAPEREIISLVPIEKKKKRVHEKGPRPKVCHARTPDYTPRSEEHPDTPKYTASPTE